MKVTIVLATLNREEELKKVISDLNNQTFKDFKIHISTEKGIVNAMNTALKNCDTDIITRIDDDMEIPPTWLEHVVDTFKEDVGGVTGPTIVPRELRENRDVFGWEKLPNWLKRIYLDYFQEGKLYQCAIMNRSGAFTLGSNYETALEDETIRECHTMESCNYSLRTDLVKKLGGWDTKFGGVCEYFEQDMVWKIRKLGYKILYNPKAYLFHLVSKQGNYSAREDYIDRLENFIRFYMRHIYTPKHTLRFLGYLAFQCGYYAYKSLASKSGRS